MVRGCYILKKNKRGGTTRLLLKYVQADCLEWNGNKVGTNVVADHFKSCNKFAVQFTGTAKHFVHTGVGRFFLRGFAFRTDFFEAGMDVISFAFTVPEERRCVEFIAPDVVLFDQYKPGF